MADGDDFQDAAHAGRGASPGTPRWVALGGVGVEFLLTILLPGALGWWIDAKLGSGPVVMLVLGAVGFGAALVRLMKVAKRGG